MIERPPKSPSPARRFFRACRIAALLGVLSVLTLVLWSNYVAVPGFIAAPLKEELRRNNVDLDFARLKLNGFRRVIAEQLTISPVAFTNQSRVRALNAELVFRPGHSLKHPLEISGLRLEGGELSLALNDPAAPPLYLSITNLQARLDFLPGDTLRISGLSGEAFGAKADLSGVLRNFSQFRLAEPPPGSEGKHWRKQLRDVLEIAEQLAFVAPPELTLTFNTDAADIARSRASVTLRADEGSSRWGKFHRLRLNSSVYPLTNEPAVQGTFRFDLSDLGSTEIQASAIHLSAATKWSSDMQQLLTNHVSLAASNAITRWLSLPDLQAELSSATQKEMIRSEFHLGASQLTLGETRLRDGSLRASLRHALPFPTPAQLLGTVLSSVPAARSNRQTQEIAGDWSFSGGRVHIPKAEAEALNASGEISALSSDNAIDPALGFWDYLRPFDLPWQLQLSNLTAGDVKIGNLVSTGRWSFPELAVKQVTADLYRGKLKGEAHLDVSTRRLTTSSESSFDYRQAAILLDPPVQRWFAQFAWENPPFVQTELSLILPPWGQTWERLAHSILPTLTLSGRFEGRGSFRGVPLGLAESHFTFTNFVWTLPDLRITRPEGSASVRYAGNLTNQEISARLESQIDPTILSAAFDKALEPAFQMVRFATPPLLRAEIHGDLDNFDTLSARGDIALTNFFAKEQAFTDLRVDFHYTNRSIELTDLVAHRGKEEVHAPYSRVDIPAEVMFVTNAISTIDPYVAMSIVGDEVYEAIDPYRFANSPTVTINGFVPLRHVSKADIHFGVAGTDFTYWKFHLPALAGDVYWKGHELSFSNVHAAFYNGTADWSAYFLIDDKTDSARFSFHGFATNASLHPLVHDLFGVTNRLEGTFSGDLVIDSANTASMQSWNGYGNATLKDGYLWAIPIFGVFSPALDSIAPGLGSAPISSGAGDFSVTNSVIHTRNLQVRAPAFRLNYRGNVDLAGKLDARVEAEILRDTWVLGKLVSTALWPVSKAFEATVTGTLDNPKTKFRYVPKFIFAPFKVLGAIGEAAKKKEAKNPAPAPPGGSPP